MKRFYAATLFLLSALFALTVHYRGEPDSIYGIADTTEVVINSEMGVEIVRLPVVAGQRVSVGDTLVAMQSPELDLRISQITNGLSVSRTRETTHATLSRSELLGLQAEQQEKASEIRAELNELEAQYNLNRQLVTELRGFDGELMSAGQEDDSRNPIKAKIESLKKLLALAQDPTRAYQNRLNDAMSSSGRPLTEEAKLLEEELKILLQDKQRLLVTSPIEGLVGTVNFRIGEKVKPFMPILTVHATSPSFVRGYIHEDISSRVAVGQKVFVRSNQDRSHVLEGVIVGVGARIVEYPERLRKRPDIIIWGREIMVKIPPENRFLLGEKVRIALQDKAQPQSLGLGKPAEPVKPVQPETSVSPSPKPSVPPSQTYSHPSSETLLEMKPVQVAAAGFATSGGAAELPGIEASGLLFASDLGRFLVIDDEAKKNPSLSLVDTNGRIDGQLPIEGLGVINDMEAITEDAQGHLYVLASQSLNKKGKLPKARTVLAKLTRQGRSLKLVGQVHLRDALEKAALAQPEEEWAKFIRQGIAEGSMDIEGMTAQGEALLLGFKAPLLKGEAVILKLQGLTGLLEGKSLQKEDVTLFKTLNLKHQATGTLCGISDLLHAGGKLHVLSTGTAKSNASESHVGELFIYDEAGQALLHRRDLGGIKAEGVALVGTENAIFIAVDNGNGKASQLFKAGVMR